MRRFIIIALFGSPLIALLLARRSLLGAFAVIFISHMLALYATLRPTCGWWGPVVTSFAPRGREVWLTIDDGPHPDDTATFVRILHRFEAKATFFVKGRNVDLWPHAARAALQAGHALANHSQTHPAGSFWMARPATIEREIDACNEALIRVGVGENRLFRAPVGLRNMFVHPALSRRRIRLIAWTARGFDGARATDPARVVDRIYRDVRPGAIVLLHEGVITKAGDSFSASCLEILLERLSKDGYRVVIPSEEQLVSR